jgi:hypothetical protein
MYLVKFHVSTLAETWKSVAAQEQVAVTEEGEMQAMMFAL